MDNTDLIILIAAWSSPAVILSIWLAIDIWRNRHHTHHWLPTAINLYGVIIEEQCRYCGEYRHRTSDDLQGVPMGGEPHWKPGKHPYQGG